jgi:hypothetical protein
MRRTNEPPTVAIANESLGEPNSAAAGGRDGRIRLKVAVCAALLIVVGVILLLTACGAVSPATARPSARQTHIQTLRDRRAQQATAAEESELEVEQAHRECPRARTNAELDAESACLRQRLERTIETSPNRATAQAEEEANEKIGMESYLKKRAAIHAEYALKAAEEGP